MTGWTAADQAHVFACWTAGTAGNMPKKGPSVARARSWLEAAGFARDLSIDALQTPEAMDDQHRLWRAALIDAAGKDGYSNLSHGRAAKFINTYLKTRFGLSGNLDAAPAALLHPPIDSLLLGALVKQDWKGHRAIWQRFNQSRWSNLTSQEYEELIAALRTALEGAPLWTIEHYWPGAR